MPNNKSAKKRVKVTLKKNEVNKSAKSELKTVLKKAKAEGATKENVAAAVKKLDKAATSGLIHKNKAARLKSRLAKKQNAPA